MTSNITLDGVAYSVYRRETEYSAAIQAERNGDRVLVSRPCAECGDRLLGSVTEPKSPPTCEPGHHGSRPGGLY